MTAVDDRWAWIDAGYTLDPDEPDDDDPDPGDDRAAEHRRTDNEPYRLMTTLPDIANYQDRNTT